MMSHLIRGSKAKRSTTSKKNKNKNKTSLTAKYCDFILFLKSKNKTKIKEIEKKIND